MATIYPSLCAVGKQSIKQTVRLFDPQCHGFHLDLMDGRFVNNTGLAAHVVKDIAQETKKHLWVHLMVEHPSDFADQLDFLREGDLATFHLESTGDPKKMINLIHEKKLKVGIALRPKTPVADILPFAKEAHHILLMSVEPGFSGQAFLKEATDRLKLLVELRRQHNLHFQIAMDGGINEDNIRTLVANGLELCAAGSAIFDQPDPLAAFKRLSQLAQ